VLIWRDLLRFEQQCIHLYASQKNEQVQMLKCEKIVELMGYRTTPGGEQLPADLWKELLLSKKLDMSLFKLNMIRELYPHKAIGLFKLYSMLSN
jgi:hypothetical protein